MYLPVLFGQGHIGIILYGAARSGKSTLLKAMGYLRLGRKPRSPSGLNKRDLLAVLQRRQIVFFDEVKTITPELEETLKRMITHDGDEIRALYTNLETVEADLEGSAVFCATSLSQLASDLRTRCFVWHLEEKEGSLYEQDILDFCEALWRLALGGAIKLYRQAARLKRPPNNLLPEIRFRDWLSWAYRYAVVLGVEKEFVAFVKRSKSAAHSGTKYDFLIDLLSREDFDTSKEYNITDLIELAFPKGEATDGDAEADETKAQSIRAAKALQYALKSEAVRADLIAMARDMGYNLRIEKKKVKGEKKEKYRFIFSRLEIPQESDRLRAILKRLGIKPDWDPDWDGEAAPSAEPIPQNDPVPMPEVQIPTPAPQIAPPAPEAVPMAAQGSPAEVGGDAPFAAPYTDTLTPAMQAYLRASDELANLLTHLEARIVEPKEPELLLIIVETIKGVKKLRELFPLLRERDGDNIDVLTLGYRTLYACMWGHMSILCGLATFRGLSLEGLLPHPKVGWAVVRRVLLELEGFLKGEEVSLWPLPEPRKAQTDPAPTPPPIEPEPKWREAWELFAEIPAGHPTRLAILKGLEPDPIRDWEYHTKHLLIRALLNGMSIDPPF
jgi:hypothetical protein